MNGILVVCKSKKFTHLLIPIRSIESVSHFPDATIVYTNGVQQHGNIPAIVGRDIADIWGGIEYVKSKGYSKHLAIFQDNVTGLYYLGNYRAFIESKLPYERERAKHITQIDVDTIINLIHK